MEVAATLIMMQLGLIVLLWCRSYALESRNSRELARRSLIFLIHSSMARAFNKWRHRAADMHDELAALRKAMLRLASRQLSKGYNTWRDFAANAAAAQKAAQRCAQQVAGLVANGCVPGHLPLGETKSLPQDWQLGEQQQTRTTSNELWSRQHI